jgi:hypothetical protein
MNEIVLFIILETPFIQIQAVVHVSGTLCVQGCVCFAAGNKIRAPVLWGWRNTGRYEKGKFVLMTQYKEILERPVVDDINSMRLQIVLNSLIQWLFR